jgi:hypothetical protein
LLRASLDFQNPSFPSPIAHLIMSGRLSDHTSVVALAVGAEEGWNLRTASQRAGFLSRRPFTFLRNSG